MKTSNKLREVFDMVRPHINGHNTAINLFIEAIQEVHEMEALSQHDVSEQLVCKGKCDWGYTDGDGNELFCSIKKNSKLITANG